MVVTFFLKDAAKIEDKILNMIFEIHQDLFWTWILNEF